MQFSGSVPADRIEHIIRITFELELIKTVDCFLDIHGSYTISIVSVKKNFLCTNHTLNSTEIRVYQLTGN